MKRKCMICGFPLQGRIDKKFCSDNCRNRYHNSMNTYESMYIRNVNYILRKNRKILLELNKNGVLNIEKSNLTCAGFNFNFITSLHDNSNGSPSYFCYEQGYSANQDGTVTLLIDKTLHI
jgi:predicted nucleic acid-binding Zn ribbon protein